MIFILQQPENGYTSALFTLNAALYYSSIALHKQNMHHPYFEWRKDGFKLWQNQCCIFFKPDEVDMFNLIYNTFYYNSM